MPRTRSMLLVAAVLLAGCGSSSSSERTDRSAATTTGRAATATPEARTRTERGIADLLTRRAPDDAPGFAVRSVDCPDDFVDAAGTRTVCVAIAADGSEYDFDVRSGEERTTYTLKGGRWPGYSLASRVIGLYRAKPQNEPASGIECLDTLEFEPGARVSCTLTLATGEERELEVTSTNIGGGIRFAFAG